MWKQSWAKGPLSFQLECHPLPPTPANGKVREPGRGSAKFTNLYLFVKLSIHDPQQRY